LLKRTDNRIRVRKRFANRSFLVKNPIQYHLHATVEPTDDGSQVRGYFAMGGFTAWYMMIWFGLAALGVVQSIIYLLSAILRGHFTQIVGMFIWGPFAMLLLGYPLMLLERYPSRHEPDEISDWLQQQFTGAMYISEE
jgi:hypothetical protein